MSTLGLADHLGPHPVPRRGAASQLRDHRDTRAASDLSIVQQVRSATREGHRLAMACGMVLGGFVPIATYILAHGELAAEPRKAALVAGGLLFSATSVFGFGREAFRSVLKALGFVVLIEGVMIWSSTEPLSLAALGLLVLINAIATGTNLALQDRSADLVPD
jgi:hypothetical protein